MDKRKSASAYNKNLGVDPMTDNQTNVKIRVYITDPWDSSEIIEGFLYGEVFVDDIKSALILYDKEKWLILLPRHKGQNLLDELVNGKDTATNIIWLSDKFDGKIRKISRDLITSYSSGNAVRLE